jgi:hypothetical protein
MRYYFLQLIFFLLGFHYVSYCQELRNIPQSYQKSLVEYNNFIKKSGYDSIRKKRNLNYNASFAIHNRTNGEVDTLGMNIFSIEGIENDFVVPKKFVQSFFIRSFDGVGYSELGYPNVYYLKSVNDSIHIFTNFYFPDYNKENMYNDTIDYFLVKRDFRNHDDTSDLIVLKQDDYSLLTVNSYYDNNNLNGVSSLQSPVIQIRRKDDYDNLRYGLENLKGDIIINHSYDNIIPKEIKFGDQTKLFWILCQHSPEYGSGEEKYIYGIADSKGKLIYSPSFQELDLDFDNKRGLGKFSIFKFENKYGILNNQLKVVLDNNYSQINFLEGGFALLKENTSNLFKLFNLNNLTFRPETYSFFEEAFDVLPNEPLVKQNRIYYVTRIVGKKYISLLDNKFSVKIDDSYQFGWMGEIGEGILVAAQYINSTGQTFNKHAWNGAKEIIYFVSLSNLSKIKLDHTLSESISSIGHFSNGLVAFRNRNNRKFGFINTQGKVVIQPQFDDAKSFYNGKCVVSKFNTYYYIDKLGNRVQ